MKPGSRRLRLWRRAARALVASGVVLGAVAIIGDSSGFGWVSGPDAIGAIGAILLAFAAFNLPAATDNRDGGDDATVPFRSGGADPG